MKLICLVTFISMSFHSMGQVLYHTEIRFCGIEKCRSLFFEVNSPYLELWTRFENYPGAIINNDEFPAITSPFGYTVVGGIGLPQAKLILGVQNGEFVQGIHLYGENEASTFRTNIVLFHKPPFPNDAFRLDGELNFEKYFTGSSFEKSRNRKHANTSWGAVLRMECYEPTPIVIHSGLALRRTSNQKSVVEARKRPGGDFLDSFDPHFLNQFRGTGFTTDWSLAVGPSYYLNKTTGVNLTVNCHF